MNAPTASLMSLFLLAGCAVADVADDGGAVITPGGDVAGVRDGRTVLAIGQTLSIGLESNATTGYRWQVSGVDPDVLTPGAPFGQEITHPGSPGMVGVGGVTHWRFTATRPGSVTLTFAYGRSWMPDERPAETATYRIVVR